MRLPDLSCFETMPLAVMRRAFNDPEWIFEIKYDGFRSLAYVEETPTLRTCRLVSRNRKDMSRRFDHLARAIAATVPYQAVLDGEVVCLGPDGEPQFYELMRNREPKHFYAFDLLWLDGADLRGLPLLERKRMLRELTPPKEAGSQLLYVDHVVEDGILLYTVACERDLEGIVAKRAQGLYTPDETTWVKIKNPHYSQQEGRHELFERKR